MTSTAPAGRTRQKASKTVLHLHLSQGALDGHDPAAQIGRVANTRMPVTAAQIRDWCGRPDTDLTIKPVVDLADHVSVDAYEVPDRIAEAIALRDHSCVSPWCTRPARKLKPDEHPCDCDHVIPYRHDGSDAAPAAGTVRH